MNYNLNEKAIIWLNLFEFLSLDKKHAILDFYDQPQDIFSSFKSDYLSFQKILTKEQFDKMSSALNQELIDAEIVNLDKDEIQVVTCASANYPTDFFKLSRLSSGTILQGRCVADEILFNRSGGNTKNN